MVALTQNEREDLKDVFISIHTSHNRYKKIQNILNIMIFANILIASFYLHAIFLAN